MQTLRLSADGPKAIARAVKVLKKGGIVAFPTDTVYGIGAPAFDVESIERLYEVKGREHAKAIAILISSQDELKLVAVANKAALRLAKRFWPGPLTLVLPRNPKVPEALSQGATIGVRVSDHAVARGLLAAVGPMGVSSANVSGQANTRTADEVLAQLGGRIEMVLDGGQTPGDRPSTVVDLTGEKPKVLRVGPISEEQILEALG